MSALIFASSLALGPFISASHHDTSKAAFGVRATLHWESDLRWQRADDGGRPFKAALIGNAYLRITARGIKVEVLSLRPFLAADHAYSAVGGCGAATNLAILRKTGSTLPYVVVFVVLAEKGCLAVPIVFVPVRTGDRYQYVGAPYYAIWSSQPTAMARMRAATVDRVSLPCTSFQAGEPCTWTVFVVANGLAAGPRVAAFEPPGQPKQIRAGSKILLGDSYHAWFAADR